MKRVSLQHSFFTVMKVSMLEHALFYIFLSAWGRGRQLIDRLSVTSMEMAVELEVFHPEVFVK